jgi:glycosyltransferase involved in cell wall biosynthesis
MVRRRRLRDARSSTARAVLMQPIHRLGKGADGLCAAAGFAFAQGALDEVRAAPALRLPRIFDAPVITSSGIRPFWVPTRQRAYTLAMVAAEPLRRAGSRLRAIKALRKGSTVPRALVVSNVPNLGGGGALSFCDFVLALRTQQPDLDVVGVYPRKGSLAAECARHGVRTEIAWVPSWAYLEQWRERINSPLAEALVGALLVPLSNAVVAALLVPGILRAVLLLVRLRPTMVLSNTMVIPSHAVAAKLLGIPHYWLVHEFGRADHWFRFALGERRTIRLIGRLSESVICNSQAVEKALLAQEPHMKTHVIYPVVDTPLGKPPERHPGEPMRAVLVGHFFQSKGQHVAVEAVAIARTAGVEIELVLVGPGDHKPVEKLARRLDVADLVNIHGPTDDVGPYWSAAHVGLMCSDCEAFGRVTVEAMRAGLPVCGTNSGGTLEIIDPGVNGLLSPAGDANALAANLMALESDEELRRSLAFRAVETARRFERTRHDNELANILGLS